MKRFEYLSLSIELNVKTTLQKQYQNLDNISESNKIIKKEKPRIEKYNKSNPIYDSKYSFYPYCNIINFNSLSLRSKYPIFLSF